MNSKAKERFEELVRFERSVFQMQLTPLIVLENEDNGMVIFRSEGLLNGRPFRNELAIVFEFEAGRIRSFREYVGMPLKTTRTHNRYKSCSVYWKPDSIRIRLPIHVPDVHAQ